MSVCNDKQNNKSSTSRQLFNHVKKSETTMPDVRDLMLEILTQYRKVDKVGFSLGVLDKASSFSDELPWCSIIGKLDHNKQTLDKMSKSHLVKIVDHLDELTTTFNEQLVMKIQQYRDLWMRKVLLWDLFLYGFLILGATAGIYWSAIGFDSSSYLELIKQRPFFFLLTAFSVTAVLLISHFFIRRSVMNNMLEDIVDELPSGMSLLNALNFNSRIRHSIFRPEPVGWNYIQKQRLESISRKTMGIRDELGNILASHVDGQAA